MSSEAQSGSPILEVENLRSGYGATRVLHGVSLTVPRGAVVALLGANGAGKTTLLRAISGLLPITDGAVRLNGQDITTLRAHSRSLAGMCCVPEGRGIFRSLTVRENLRLQARPGQERRALEVATQAFPILGQRLNQVAGMLSGGEQQMLAVSQAYLNSPEIILVDEVSMGLAPRVVDAVFESLYAINAMGAAVLLVDQFATRALDMASTAYVLRRGEMAFSGPSRDLLGADLFEQYLGASAVT